MLLYILPNYLIKEFVIYVFLGDFSYTATDVSFEQSTYSVYEDSRPVQLLLLLTNPSSTDLIIGVKMLDQQTPSTGMYIH